MAKTCPPLPSEMTTTLATIVTTSSGRQQKYSLKKRKVKESGDDSRRVCDVLSSSGCYMDVDTFGRPLVSERADVVVATKKYSLRARLSGGGNFYRRVYTQVAAPTRTTTSSRPMLRDS